jgi:hypothetical protein
MQSEDIACNRGELFAFDTTEPFFYLALVFDCPVNDLLRLFVGEPCLGADD